MSRKLLLTTAIVLIFVASHVAKQGLPSPDAPRPDEAGPSRRIVSMAPSITETLFALDLGERVVGVTRFCQYPEEAQQKAPVGGYMDPNFEAILGLRADLVVMLDEHARSQPAFGKLGLQTLSVCHRDLDGILDSITAIGSRCRREELARQKVDDIRARLERVRQKTAGLERPRVMIAVGRTRIGSGRLEDLCIAGLDRHLNRIIEAAGGQNAYQLGAAPFPVVSHEGVLRMDPEVIVDLVRTDLPEERIRSDWQQVNGVLAVRDERVHVVDDDFATIPGPRFILLVEKLARLIHPDVPWD